MKIRMNIVAFACVLAASLFLPGYAIGQVSGDELRSTRMIDSFGRTGNGDVKGRLDIFFYELNNEPKSTGLIINHGDSAQITARKRLIQNQIVFRRFDASRIRFRSGINVGDFRTDLWIIPENGPDPEIRPEAWIAIEFRRVTRAQLRRLIDQYFGEFVRPEDQRGLVVNYGTSRQIAERELWIYRELKGRRYDPSRITYVNGGKGLRRTVLWIVPPGAEDPKP